VTSGFTLAMPLIREYVVVRSSFRGATREEIVIAALISNLQRQDQ